MSADLLFLTEGGEQIGLGHISRCSAIGSFFSKTVGTSEILIDWHGTVPNPTGFKSVCWSQQFSQIVEYRDQFKWILVDSYKAPLAFYGQLKGYFDKVFVIDDYERFVDYGVDLIINPNVYGSSIGYRSRFVGGKDYVILRDSFRSAPNGQTIPVQVNNLLVTIGGTDIRSILPLIAQTLTAMENSIHFVCGSDEYANNMRAAFTCQENYHFYGYVGESEMRTLMQNTQLAVSACGQTLHELAYLGVPVIGICIGDDQVMNRTAYMEAGFLGSSLDWHQPNLGDALLREVKRLTKIEERARQSKAGSNLIDGKGLERIIKAMIDA